MGRRKKRKQIQKKVVRRIPKIFLCPHCSRQTLSINIKRSLGEEYAVAHAICGECGLCAKFLVSPIMQPVDAYGKLVDLYEEYIDKIDSMIEEGECIEHLEKPGIVEEGVESIGGES